jgi:chromosome segregation protein
MPPRPMHWAGADAGEGDPSLLPAGVEPLTACMWKRSRCAGHARLKQIGVVSRVDRAPNCASNCSVGQRLVSIEGDLWRWDGYTVTADAPTAAARSLAARNRLRRTRSRSSHRARDSVDKRERRQRQCRKPSFRERRDCGNERTRPPGVTRVAANDAALHALADAEREAGRTSVASFGAFRSAHAPPCKPERNRSGYIAETATLLAPLPVDHGKRKAR